MILAPHGPAPAGTLLRARGGAGVAGINGKKVLIAGVAAGVAMVALDMLITGTLLADRGNAAMARLGLPPFTEGGLDDLAVFVGTYVILGIALAFTYAAIRPRFGAGVRTALIAGVMLWVPGLPIITGMAAMGVLEWSLVAVSVVPSIIVSPAGPYVAGWLYTGA